MAMLEVPTYHTQPLLCLRQRQRSHAQSRFRRISPAKAPDNGLRASQSRFSLAVSGRQTRLMAGVSQACRVESSIDCATVGLRSHSNNASKCRLLPSLGPRLSDIYPADSGGSRRLWSRSYSDQTSHLAEIADIHFCSSFLLLR